MKTNREARYAETGSTLTLPAFHRSDTKREALAALSLLLGALQFQLFVGIARAESSVVGNKAGTGAWSLQVEQVNPGAVGLEPSFRAAIYENLIEELAKAKVFKHVFRSGDRSANDVSDLLILKTMVQKYAPGSETRRAVTTLKGATKLNVRIQLADRAGHVLLEKAVNGNVRFIGGNLRATHNLAHNIAEKIKGSAMPVEADPDPERETGQISK
jgi:hypothetical protein